jgi:hypothetical protein
VFSVVFIEIPYSKEQGILKTEQGIVSSEQGISLKQQRSGFEVYSANAGSLQPFGSAWP